MLTKGRTPPTYNTSLARGGQTSYINHHPAPITFIAGTRCQLNFAKNYGLQNTVVKTCVKMMASENMDEWKASVAVIDETVKVARDFLKNHPEEIKTKEPKHYKVSGRDQKGYTQSPLAFQIAEFLGWDETKVYHSLDRLGLIEQGKLDKGAVQSMPTERHARELTKSVKKKSKTSAPVSKPAPAGIAIGGLHKFNFVRIFGQMKHRNEYQTLCRNLDKG